jgi:hypothetical protein
MPPLLFVTLLLYFGAAREYLGFRIRKHAASFFAVAVAVFWSVPLILGLIVGVGGDRVTLGALIASPCPLTGFAAAFAAIGQASDSPLGPQPMTVAAAAFLVQAGLAACFLWHLAKAHARLRGQESSRSRPP